MRSRDQRDSGHIGTPLQLCWAGFADAGTVPRLVWIGRLRKAAARRRRRWQPRFASNFVPHEPLKAIDCGVAAPRRQFCLPPDRQALMVLDAGKSPLRTPSVTDRRAIVARTTNPVNSFAAASPSNTCSPVCTPFAVPRGRRWIQPSRIFHRRDWKLHRFLLPSGEGLGVFQPCFFEPPWLVNSGEVHKNIAPWCEPIPRRTCEP